MDWDDEHIRAGGMIAEVYRDRWRLAILITLHQGPQARGPIRAAFEAAVESHLSVFGTHVVTEVCIGRHLAALLQMGLVDRPEPAVRGRAARYRLTRPAIELLDATRQVDDVSVDYFTPLAELSRALRHITGPWEVMVRPGDDAAMHVERQRRRGRCLVFGVAFEVAWSYLALVSLTAGTQHSGELRARMNDTIAANRDVLTTGVIGYSQLYRALERLEGAQLIEADVDLAGCDHMPPGARNRVYRLTAFGDELAAALLPLADCGISHDAALAQACRAKQRRPRGHRV